MSSNIPTQLRTIDPFSNHNSNIVNQLTRMITRHENCISGSSSSLDIIIDSTSADTGLILLPGIAYKDDVIIEITENLAFDMDDVDFYLGSDHFNEVGYYYIALKYIYIKQKPAPEAEITIFRPSERNLLTGGYLFLKAIYVDFIDGNFVIISTHNYDPQNRTVKREYTKSYVCIEDNLPTYLYERDNGRTIYVMDRDEMFFGTSSTWESFNAVRTNIDTTGCITSQLVYIGSDKKAHPAIATNISTFCDAIVTQIGLGSDGTGKVRLYGEVINVLAETGVTINVGDKVFLSNVEAGKITNMMPQPYCQFIGTCREVTGDVYTIWFSPTFSSSSGGATSSTDLASVYDKYQDLLLESIFTTLFVDAFINTNNIDLENSTASIDVNDYKMVGNDGSSFQSLLLIDSSCDETCITKCQITASVSNENYIQWYVSNNNGVDWQHLINGLDRVHVFATTEIPTSIDGEFGYNYLLEGEWCEGSASEKRALVISHTNEKILLAHETGVIDWVEGEILTGDTSGNSTITTGPAIRLTNNHEIKVKCVWTGPADIYDYGVLYIEDINKNETSIENELNIETLFSDVYENGIMNNDGGRVYPFLDPVAIPTLNIISRRSTITQAIVDLDNNANFAHGFGKFEDGDTTPSVLTYYLSYFTADSTSEIIITNFDDAFDGQQLNVVHTGGFDVTIKNSSLIHLAGAADFIMQQYDVLSLIYSSDFGWIEKNRSNN